MILILKGHVSSQFSSSGNINISSNLPNIGVIIIIDLYERATSNVGTCGSEWLTRDLYCSCADLYLGADR